MRLSKRHKPLSKRAKFEEPFLFSFLPKQNNPPKGYKPSRWVRPIEGVDKPHIPIKLAERKMLDAINFTDLAKIFMGTATRKFVVREFSGKKEVSENTSYAKLKAHLGEKPVSLVNLLMHFEKLLIAGIKKKKEGIKSLKAARKKWPERVGLINDHIYHVQKKLKMLSGALEAYREHSGIIHNIINRIKEQKGQRKDYQYDVVPQKDTLGASLVTLDPTQAFHLEVALEQLGITKRIGYSIVDMPEHAQEDIMSVIPLYVQKGKNKIRTSRFLAQARKKLTQMMKEMEAKGQTTFTVSEWLEAVNYAMKQYETTPRLDEWSVVVSAEPSDITTMSNRGWTSCMEEGKPNCTALDAGVDTRDMVAYAISPNQKDWLARVWLRFDGKSGWWIEDEVYTHIPGLNKEQFLNKVEEYLRDHKILGKKGQFSPFAKGYSDYLRDEIQYVEYVTHDRLKEERQKLKMPAHQQYEEIDEESPRPMPGEKTNTYAVFVKVFSRDEANNIELHLDRYLNVKASEIMINESGDPIKLILILEATPTELQIAQALPGFISAEIKVPKPEPSQLFNVMVEFDFKPLLEPLLNEAGLYVHWPSLYDPSSYKKRLRDMKMEVCKEDREECRRLSIISAKIADVIYETLSLAIKKIEQQLPGVAPSIGGPSGYAIYSEAVPREQLSLLIPLLKRTNPTAHIQVTTPGLMGPTPEQNKYISRLLANQSFWLSKRT